MKIGILGAGNIGGTVGRKLAASGHEVLVGVRDPHSPKAAGVGLPLGSIAEAAAFGDVVIVALPLAAAAETLPTLDLSGKIVVDATNAFGNVPGGYVSASAAVAAWVPGARLVKGFNATPWEAIDNPIYSGLTVESYICGDDAAAKAVVAQLVRDTGLTVIDIGGLANAPLTENFARIWGAVAFGAGMGRDVAFKLVKR